jgi:endonuclease/exonuclease/phosphatase family metal-dependent hydrolase
MASMVRIATFNLENLDADPEGAGAPAKGPSLAARIQVMRPQLRRLRADVLCLQEVHGQDAAGGQRRLDALQDLIASTPYAQFHLACTRAADGRFYRERNLVILSRFPILQHRQVMNDFIAKPAYRSLTATPAETAAREIGWERPALYAQVALPNNKTLHVLNVHFKSKLPTPIEGQYERAKYRWRTVAGWAEGYFISSMKRVGQALEARYLIDTILDGDDGALIATCGDFNADHDEVPVNAIRGLVEDTGNATLGNRIMVPCEFSIPEPARYSLLHLGRKTMLDHILVSRALLADYRGTEIHNEALPDESGAFRTDVQFPESDHAPVVAEFGIG